MTELDNLRKVLNKHRLQNRVTDSQHQSKSNLLKTLNRRQQNAEVSKVLDQISDDELVEIVMLLDSAELSLIWADLPTTRQQMVKRNLSPTIIEQLGSQGLDLEDQVSVCIFELTHGRLSKRTIQEASELLGTAPIWVDLVNPSQKARLWVSEHFNVVLPDPNQLGDLEASARFYVEENGEVHLHSDFLLDFNQESRNISVAFVLLNGVLFSVRSEELPVFRLQRQRARSKPGYVNDGLDVLLDLYAADAEYSADRLEEIYKHLESVSKLVLSSKLSDDAAGQALAAIARQEDLNGLIRRNVLDTRRALSFLMRSHILTPSQLEDTRQIMRDIESLDSHTSFLFGKINFLMDAVVGFININQNKRVNKLTTFSIVFMPINVVAGIGGMSEFSMMTAEIPWPYAYSGFIVSMGIIGWLTYVILSKTHKQ